MALLPLEHVTQALRGGVVAHRLNPECNMVIHQVDVPSQTVLVIWFSKVTENFEHGQFPADQLLKKHVDTVFNDSGDRLTDLVTFKGDVNVVLMPHSETYDEDRTATFTYYREQADQYAEVRLPLCCIESAHPDHIQRTGRY